MHEPYKNKFGHTYDFKVKYRLYRPEEGGRKTGLTYQGIRYDFAYDDFGKSDFNVYMIWPEFENEDKEIITKEFELVRDSGTARMWILMDNMRAFHKGKMKLGTKGYLMEGNRKMGECEIIEVNGLLTNSSEK
jgi:hypothetical protein